jgi:serine/threonine-protein kinase RsbW
MLGRLQHRDIIIQSVSAACKRVTSRADNSASTEFLTQVVTAASEAFNNIVLHSYAGRDDGVVEMQIKTKPGLIRIEFRDWGDSFDPEAVACPDLDELPESGLGIYIMKELMEIRYEPGPPNVLTLSKVLPAKNRPEGKS